MKTLVQSGFVATLSFLSVALTASLPCVAYAKVVVARLDPNGLKIQRQKGARVLLLPEVVKQALKKHDPKFKMWEEADYSPSVLKAYAKINLIADRQTPSGVIGDFNGDLVMDVVVKGRNDTSDLVFAVLSEKKAFRVFEIKKQDMVDPTKICVTAAAPEPDCGLQEYLLLATSGRKVSPVENRSIKLRHEGFILAYFEKASILYYFEDGEFKQYVTAN